MFLEKLWKRFYASSRGRKSSRTPIDAVKRESTTDDHRIPLPELCRRLMTDAERGLANESIINQLRERYGPNRLTPPPTVPRWIKFCSHVFEGFALLLWVGAILCLIAYAMDTKELDNFYLAIILMVVVICSGVFSYMQEAKSDAIMESFNQLVPHQATVIREGNRRTIDAEQLVPGDLVEFFAGDRVPADVRLTFSAGCKVDNSSLTGESEPQSRNATDCARVYIESRNMAFFSTNCVEGYGRGLVVSIGDRTVMGTIANLTATLEQGETPLAKEISHFIRLLTYVGLTISTIFLIISLAIGTKLIDAIVFFISIIVASVPEGLLATVTVCLTLTAKRMARKNCLVKNLEAVETLGATSTICSDKTGTLTANRMTVSHMWISQQIYDARDIEYAHIDVTRNVPPRNTYEVATMILALCSKATFQQGQEAIPIDRRLTIGDASESAILKFIEATLINNVQVITVREWFPKLAEIPFNSSNKYHVTVHAVERSDCSAVVCIKGAPERVLDRCTSYVTNEGEFAIDSRFRAAFTDAYNTLGGMGERVLGFAWLQLSPEQYPPGYQFEMSNESGVESDRIPIREMQFVGLISMIDPPRPGVEAAVNKCRAAGIKVMMVTGDHPITAQAIARSVNIISSHSKVYDINNWASTSDRSSSNSEDHTASSSSNSGSRNSSDNSSNKSNTNFHNCRSNRNLSLTIERAKKHSTPNRQRPFEVKAIVITGSELMALKEEQLDRLIGAYEEIVFARTSPKQKLRIVEAFQRRGEVVAVTGDGVNDSPALKKADIGIAMGVTGSDVSRQAADLILLDDNFSSIVIGVEEGRLIFDNLKKSIAYTLTSNVPEMIPFLAYMIIGIPLGLGTVTILCIDLGTDIIPAISLAYEPPEADIMLRKPRGESDRLVNHRMIQMTYFYVGFISTAAGFFAYFAIMAAHGFFWRDLWMIRPRWDSAFVEDVRDAYGQEWSYESRRRLEYTCQTAFFIAVVVTQYFDLLICKTRRNSLLRQGLFSNDVLCFALIFETALTVFLCYCPGVNMVLRLFPLRWTWWTFGLPYGILLLLVDEVRRYFIRNNPGGFLEQETYY